MITNQAIYYVEEPSPLYMSYVRAEQTKQNGHQETLEAAGDKGH